ncbi:HD domain-containing protein [Alkalihalobacillus sp. NPDC078783]
MMLLQEPLYPDVTPFFWEVEIMQSSYFQRLKHLAHYGAGSLVSSVTHSRLEHTVGVWKLTAHFFSDWVELRAAALLHDIGHLPFSHAIERTLGYDHHQLTETYIQRDEIKNLLHKAEITSNQICDLLNKQSPLTGTKATLGLDHLDSFVRDTYMMGELDGSSFDLLSTLSCTDEGISTDIQTAEWILDLILKDHHIMHAPLLKAVDQLLSEAVRLHQQLVEDDISFLVDAQLTARLLQSPSQKAQDIIHTLLFEPYRIRVSDRISSEGLHVQKGKVYHRFPLVLGEDMSHTKRALTHTQQLHQLRKEYRITIQ